MTDYVTREDEDGLCILTLNRPEKLNALNSEIFQALDVHVTALEKQTSEIGCVVLRGAGRAFCAGMDLNVVTRENEPPGFKPAIIDRLAALPQPLIVAVQGACYTGGLELALAADFIIADPSARFADTHGKWGLVATWGAFQRLPRRVGPAAAKRLIMTSRTIDAAEAKAIGLADLLVAEGELSTETTTLAAEILANSWHTNMTAKRFMRETDGMPLDAALDHERRHYPGQAADYLERIERFTRR